jgi:cob(I)alamin adenosyltransferase
VILDELTYTVKYGWVPVDDIVQVLRDRPARTNVVVTGRYAPDEIVAIADTVTEMVKVKHAMDEGIGARKGIEY